MLKDHQKLTLNVHGIENNTITVQNQGKVLTIVKRSSKVFIKRNIIPEKTIDQTVSRAVENEGEV